MGAVSGHSNIVTVYRYGVVAETRQPYLVMEYLPGGSLGDHLANTGPIDWRTAASIGAKLCDALAVAHRAGILHRDVKPGNVFRTESGEPKLGDFGIARLDDGNDSRSGSITASIAHAPPEIIDGKRGDERSDLYSLASTIYTLASGAPPFASDPDQGLARMLTRITTEAPPPLRLGPEAEPFETALMRALSKGPDDRPATVTEFGAQLRHAAAEATVPVPAPALLASPSTASIARPVTPAPVFTSPPPAASRPAVGAPTPHGGPPIGVADREQPRSIKPAEIVGIIAAFLAVVALGGWALGQTVFGRDTDEVVVPTAVVQPTSTSALEPTAAPIATTAPAEPTAAALPTPTSPPAPTPTPGSLSGGNRDATLSPDASTNGYTVVTDPSGAISVEVPTSWTAVTETSDDLADSGVVLELPYRALAAGGTFADLSGIVGIRDLSTSGISIFATRVESPAAPADLLITAALDIWEDCERGDRSEIDIDGAPATYQLLSCENEVAGVVVMTVLTVDDPFVVVTINLQFATIPELDALPTIISTIAIDPSQVPTG